MSKITLQMPGDGLPPEQLPGKRTAHEGQLTADTIALYLNNSINPLIVNLPPDIILGRASPNADAQPTIDLAQYGGYETGVSRFHALIRRTDQGDIMITDQGSANGTTLNRTRLNPFTPTRLKSGDVLRLGQLWVEVYFGVAVETAPKVEPPHEEIFSIYREPASQNGGKPVNTPAAASAQPAAPDPLATRIFPDNAQPAVTTHFQGTVSLDAKHVFSQSGVLTEKLIRQLRSINGCSINLTLEIDARAASGFDEATINAIRALCQELKFTKSQFDGD